MHLHFTNLKSLENKTKKDKIYKEKANILQKKNIVSNTVINKYRAGRILKTKMACRFANFFFHS